MPRPTSPKNTLSGPPTCSLRPSRCRSCQGRASLDVIVAPVGSCARQPAPAQGRRHVEPNAPPSVQHPNHPNLHTQNASDASPGSIRSLGGSQKAVLKQPKAARLGLEMSSQAINAKERELRGLQGSTELQVISGEGHLTSQRQLASRPKEVAQGVVPQVSFPTLNW